MLLRWSLGIKVPKASRTGFRPLKWKSDLRPSRILIEINAREVSLKNFALRGSADG
jgi:hypothetical protein